ncbi:MAG: hypothetical protein WC899_13120 [bacterium]
MTSSTQYLWYQDLLVDDNEQDVAEYFRVNVTKIDKEGKINIYGYGRGTKQISSDQDYLGRLYYLYVDYRDVLKDHLDLRAGRTYVSSAAVSGTIDGAYLDFRNLGPVGVTVFGGRNVIFDEKREIGTRGDALAGMSVYLDTVKNTHIELSAGRKYRDTDVARENIGLDFSTTPIGKVNIYGRLKYDTIAETTNELLFGAKVAPFNDLVLRGEYYQSYATFDTASIFSVFAVNQYKEGSLSAEYRINDKYRVNAKFAREDFDDDADANVFELGFLAKPIKDLTLDASYEKRSGFAGKLDGIRLHGEYKIAKATLQAGIDYDDFRREWSRDDSAKKYWGAVSYEYSKMISAILRAEDDVNFRYDNSYQGFAAVNLNF